MTGTPESAPHTSNPPTPQPGDLSEGDLGSMRSSFGVGPDIKERYQQVNKEFDAIDLRMLRKGGHRRCWKFLTHPEGWLDNLGVLLVVSVPVWVFTCVIWQGSLPSIFVLGTINLISITSSLLLVVPESRNASTYSSLRHMTHLLNYDPRMTPNSWRHLYTLGSFIFQMLVLAAVLMKEFEIVSGYFLTVDSGLSTDVSLFYWCAEVLSASFFGNLITLVLTCFTATFFGFSWVVGCFEDR